jgi:hypothetical protein
LAPSFEKFFLGVLNKLNYFIMKTSFLTNKICWIFISLLFFATLPAIASDDKEIPDECRGSREYQIQELRNEIENLKVQLRQRIPSAPEVVYTQPAPPTATLNREEEEGGPECCIAFFTLALGTYLYLAHGINLFDS